MDFNNITFSSRNTNHWSLVIAGLYAPAGKGTLKSPDWMALCDAVETKKVVLGVFTLQNLLLGWTFIPTGA